MTGLVDQYGVPIDRQRLLVEQAAPSLTSVRNIISGHPAEGLTPERLGWLLREAEFGEARAYLELAEQMEERDLHYLGVLGKRKRAIAQLATTVVAASESADDKAAAELIRTFLGRLELQDEIFDILDAIGKGYSVTEIIWDVSGNQWMPKKLKHRDPRWFRHSLIDGDTLELWDNAGFLPMAPYQFVVHTAKAKSGLPIRGGLARAVAWNYLFKNFDVKSWVIFAETYGHPLRVGRYGPGATVEDKKALLTALRNIAQDCAAMIPQSMGLEFVESKMGTAGHELFEKMADWFDKQTSKAVLGQVGTTDAIAGGHAVGRVHKQVEEDIERADAKALEATLNRDLVKPIVDLNMGPRPRYPLLKIVVEDAQDAIQLANAVGAMVDRGLQVSQADMRQRLGLAEPKPGDPVLVPATSGGGDLAPAPAPNTGLSAHGAAAGNAAADNDSIDTLINEQLADWKPLVQPLLQPVERLLGECSSYEEFLKRLPGVVPKMDAKALTEALARCAFAARLAGETEADIGSN
jgi:phage gp29-like protein